MKAKLCTALNFKPKFPDHCGDPIDSLLLAHARVVTRGM